MASECRRNPTALLLDEAHTVDQDVCQALLNIAQKVCAESPFLLVMAGTPGLIPLLRQVNATFVERVKKTPIGRLLPRDAESAIRIPLQRDGMAISDSALAKAVEDAQGYPYFLQLWGQMLWDCANGHGLKALDDAEVDEAVRVIAAQREGLYNDRYDVLRRDAQRLGDEINSIDFIWCPSMSAMVEPGIPSFMDHVKSRVEQSAPRPGHAGAKPPLGRPPAGGGDGGPGFDM